MPRGAFEITFHLALSARRAIVHRREHALPFLGEAPA